MFFYLFILFLVSQSPFSFLVSAFMMCSETPRILSIGSLRAVVGVAEKETREEHE